MSSPRDLSEITSVGDLKESKEPVPSQIDIFSVELKQSIGKLTPLNENWVSVSYVHKDHCIFNLRNRSHQNWPTPDHMYKTYPLHHNRYLLTDGVYFGVYSLEDEKKPEKEMKLSEFPWRGNFCNSANGKILAFTNNNNYCDHYLFKHNKLEKVTGTTGRELQPLSEDLILDSDMIDNHVGISYLDEKNHTFSLARFGLLVPGNPWHYSRHLNLSPNRKFLLLIGQARENTHSIENRDGRIFFYDLAPIYAGSSSSKLKPHLVLDIPGYTSATYSTLQYRWLNGCHVLVNTIKNGVLKIDLSTLESQKICESVDEFTSPTPDKFFTATGACVRLFKPLYKHTSWSEALRQKVVLHLGAQTPLPIVLSRIVADYVGSVPADFMYEKLCDHQSDLEGRIQLVSHQLDTVKNAAVYFSRFVKEKEIVDFLVGNYPNADLVELTLQQFPDANNFAGIRDLIEALHNEPKRVAQEEQEQGELAKRQKKSSSCCTVM